MSQTLREALDAFHARNHAVINEAGTINTDRFYDNHDVAHVVFGCDTSLQGEGMVKLWTIFGTDLGFFGHFRAYRQANALDAFLQYSRKHILSDVSKLVLTMPVVIKHARQMKKKWQWAGYEPLLDKPLDDIREAFNIQPVSNV